MQQPGNRDVVKIRNDMQQPGNGKLFKLIRYIEITFFYFQWLACDVREL